MVLKVDEFQVPQPIGFNYEELKRELLEKTKIYETAVYTEDQVKLAKADRAALNKLKTALNDERIRREREYMGPFNEFKAKIAELIKIIESPIDAIDRQIKEYDEVKKQEKKMLVGDLFKTIGFPEFVSLDMIADKRWLNASCTLSSIENTMRDHLYAINGEVKTISQLPEYSFEALEIYKKTLDLSRAIAKANELSDLAKKKAAEEEKRKQEQVKEAEKLREKSAAPVLPEVQKEKPAEPVMQLDFRVRGTREQLMGLRQYMIDNNITFGRVE